MFCVGTQGGFGPYWQRNQMIVRTTNYPPLAVVQKRNKVDGVADRETGNGSCKAGEFTTAFAELAPRAEQDEPLAQIALTDIDFNGKGLPRNLETRTVSWRPEAVDRQCCVVVLVCAHGLLREGLGHILSEAHFVVAATAARVDDVMPSLLAEERLILLILEVSGDQDATVAQIRLFREQHPTARIALLADSDQLSDDNIIGAFRSGADAYFQNPSCEAFVKSLELVMLGGTILPPAILSNLVRQKGEVAASDAEMGADSRRSPTALSEVSSTQPPRLSGREECVLRGLIEGSSNKIIARKYEIAEATVKVHVKAVLRKIRVNNRTQAAIWAMNHERSLVGRTRPV
jgi:two-component system, NarL family, nitrate/nitrite response regulator NarL